MKKIVSILSLSLISIGILSACSSDISNKESKGNNDGKTEIKITWRDQGETDNLKNFLTNTFIPEFEKENDDIKIVLSPITASEGDYFSKVALSMQSESTAPDVVAEDTFMLNSDANAGYLLPLDDKVKLKSKELMRVY